MRTTNYTRMVNYNISVPDVNVPIIESFLKKYDVIAEPIAVVAEPIEDYTPNEETIRAIEEGRIELAKHKKGLIKGYTSGKALINDIFGNNK